MTRFRPCIDLHDGRVKQIVGSTLTDGAQGPRENFVSDRPASWFAGQYREDGLTGGHVIMLGKGNEKAAREALGAFPGGLQIGGGIRVENAAEWLAEGASHVIVTSFIFDSDGRFNEQRLRQLVAEVGADRLVLDLSCKATSDGWKVAMNRWQTLTDLTVDVATLDHLAESCAEFLVHAVDVEGKCEGIDRELARFLGQWGRRPLTYAGGISRLEDLWEIHQLSGGRMDATVGSALDLFGGSGVKYNDCVRFSRAADDKAALRIVARARLAGMTQQEAVIKSERLLSSLMRDERWLPQQGGVVALFGGLPGEPDLLPLIPWLQSRGLRPAFMDVEADALQPRFIKQQADLITGPLGVLQPSSQCPVLPADSVEVVLTPALAFGQRDHTRLGRGKGYYDRFFARVPHARRIGIGWSTQVFEVIPADAHDLPLHALVTEQGWQWR